MYIQVSIKNFTIVLLCLILCLVVWTQEKVRDLFDPEIYEKGFRYMVNLISMCIRHLEKDGSEIKSIWLSGNVTQKV
nr:TPA_asm: P4 [Sesamum betacytorhabdovirus 1_Ses]